MLSRVALLVLILLPMGCDLGGGGALSPGSNAGSTRTFDVDLDTPLGPVRSFGGLDGDVPMTSITEDNWAKGYQQHGVDMARVPRGSGCAITLDAVCPDPAVSATTDPLCNYGYDTLDRTMTDLLQMGIQVVWQAMFDVGKGGCEPRDGIEVATRPVGDPEVWPAVISQVLVHLRSKGLLPSMVEFLPDAMGVGGYQANQTIQLLNLYTAFITRLRADFPPDRLGKKPFLVLAPSLPFGEAADLEDPDSTLAAFIDDMAPHPARHPDRLSVSTVACTPGDRLALWQALRERLDEAGMTEVGLADVGPRLTDSTWLEMDDKLATAGRRSAFLAARLAAARILGQGRLDLMAADRRSGPRSGDDKVAGEDLFFDSDGDALPALNGTLPLHLMASRGAVRVKMDENDEPENDTRGFVAMAATYGETSVALMATASEAARVGQVMNFQFNIHGLPSWAGYATLRRAVVDEGTRAFSFVETSTVKVVDGGIFVSREITVPSIHYYELDLLKEDPSVGDVIGGGKDVYGGIE